MRPLTFVSKRVNGEAVSYLPMHSSHDSYIHIIHDSHQDGPEYDLSLEQFLDTIAVSEDRATFFIFEFENRSVFFLWTTWSPIASTHTMDDALSMSQQFLVNSQESHLCLSLSSEKASEPVMAVFIRHNPKQLFSQGLPPALQNKLLERYSLDGSTEYKSWSYLQTVLKLDALGKSSLWICALIACFLVAGIFATKLLGQTHPHDRFHSWIQYDTRGSVGPRYQLSVNRQNASELASYMAEHGEWAFRIDDQAIIPVHLMDHEEQGYQQWFERRYPETKAIAHNNEYINETWLRSPLVDKVPVDDMFHFSHCVLAVKRYIKAKETGRHVCGRDIDREHVQHCLEALDWWAFPRPGGKRGDTVPNELHYLSWRTKICFD